jgi:OHCU decarboxylase
MEGARPFRSADDLAAAADRIWHSLSKDDWLEAFAAHPKIGSPGVVAGTGFNLHPPQPTNLPPPNSDRSRAWSRHEQAGTKGASPETLANLADANRDYEERFGHIFIVCASGRNAGEMLALLESRLHNEPQRELEIAAEEQRKITRLRLEKLLATEGE